MRGAAALLAQCTRTVVLSVESFSWSRLTAPVQQSTSWDAHSFSSQAAAASSSSSSDTDTADYEVETIQAERRSQSGTRQADRLREAGKTPAILFSLPNNESILLSLDSKDITKKVAHLQRRGFYSTLYSLQISGPDGGRTVPALPRQVHVNAATDVVENVTFLYCPPERTVRVDVPVMTIGHDTCPGVKKGGWVHLIRRTIPCQCPGDKIPSHVEVDVTGLEIGQRIPLDALRFPAGVQVAVTDYSHPVVKISGKASRD